MKRAVVGAAGTIWLAVGVLCMVLIVAASGNILEQALLGCCAAASALMAYRVWWPDA